MKEKVIALAMAALLALALTGCGEDTNPGLSFGVKDHPCI